MNMEVRLVGPTLRKPRRVGQPQARWCKGGPARHHGRRSSDLGFRDEQVNVPGHDDITHDYEAIALAGLFENREKPVTAPGGAQKGQSPVAGASDKVQVMSAVGTVQTAGHDTDDSIRSIVARPCKERKDRAPRVLERER